jgi:Cof subfamily protein (haloacid dehalogenase superfamily)
MDIKLIAFDLDGTALNSAKLISPRTASALKAAMDAGKILVPCTGRSIGHLPESLLAIEGFPFIVTVNGAQIFSMPRRESIFLRTFEPAAALSLLTECRDFEALIFCSFESAVAFDSKGRGWEEEKTRAVIQGYLKNWSSPVKDMELFIRGSSGGPTKFSVNFGDPRKQQEAFQRLLRRKDAHVSSSDPINIELMPPGAHKGGALEFLTRRLGISMEQVMAIGDNYNDIEMIRGAGYGVAMGNGVDSLKAEADFITLPCDEDGAALAIEGILAGPFASAKDADL